MNTKVFSILLFFFSFHLCVAQSGFHWPTDEHGNKVVSEKFEMLEKLSSLQHIEDNSIKESFDEMPLKAKGEIQVGDSDETEFELHAIVNPEDENHIVVGCMNFEVRQLDFEFFFSIYVTKDFGDTWEKSDFTGVIDNSMALGGGDPVFAFDNNNDLVVSWLLIHSDTLSQVGTWGLYSSVSNDGGLTWGDDLVISKSTFTDLTGFTDLTLIDDKEWLTSDLNPSSPYFGNVYTAYVELDLQSPIPSYTIKSNTKKIGENSYSDDVILSDDNFSLAQYTSIDCNNSGEVFVTFLADDDPTFNSYSIYMTKSSDGGETFEQNQKIVDLYFPQLLASGEVVSGMNPLRLYPCPHLAIDKSSTLSNGYMYVTYTAFGVDNRETDGLDIYIVRSEDNGQTWTDPVKVNDDINPDTHQFYSSIDVNDKGQVVLSWYDRRNDGDNDLTDYFVGISNDYGETFKQYAVSSESSDFEENGRFNNNVGVGEYNQIVTSGDYVIPFWSDSRTNDGKIAIYANFIDLNDMTSVSEKSTLLNPDFSITGPYPNPTAEHANLSFSLKSSSEIEILVLDITGKLVFEKSKEFYPVGEHVIELSLKNMDAGEYIIHINSDLGMMHRKIQVTK